MTDNLYREEILEHYQSPHNFGKMEGADGHSRQTNPLCGDDIAMWVKFQENKITHQVCKAITFFGKGCAICMAAASMLTDYALGKSKEQLTKFSENDMLKMLGIEVSEIRRKCALLALYVLKDAIKSKS